MRALTNNCRLLNKWHLLTSRGRHTCQFQWRWCVSLAMMSTDCNADVMYQVTDGHGQHDVSTKRDDEFRRTPAGRHQHHRHRWQLATGHCRLLSYPLYFCSFVCFENQGCIVCVHDKLNANHCCCLVHWPWLVPRWPRKWKFLNEFWWNLDRFWWSVRHVTYFRAKRCHLETMILLPI